MKIIIPFLLVFTILACSQPKNKTKGPIAPALKRVTQLQEANNIKKANWLLDSLIYMAPDSAEPYFRLAHSKTIHQPDLFKIMTLLDSCLKREPNHSKALYLKSQGLMFMGKFDQALQVENQLLMKYPNQPQLILDRLSTYLFNGDFETAINESPSLIDKYSNILEIERIHRVSIYSKYFLGKYEKALEELETYKAKGYQADDIFIMINNKQYKHKDFAKGNNVGNTPCSLNQLNSMFPEN